MHNQVKSKSRVAQFGEVLTPEQIVDAMQAEKLAEFGGG